MLQTQLPSMSSTSVSSYKLNGILPPLRQQQDFAWPWERDTCSRGRHNHTPPLGFSGNRSYCDHGLRTPPRDMSGMDGNPLLAQNGGGQSYKRVPVVGSNALQPHYSQATANESSNTSSRPQPFYDSYYSAKRPQSPLPIKKETAAQIEQAARRRASTDNNSIASHLQIPRSINDSKGSLPEFAAQITCFFWFESSFTLHFVEDATIAPNPVAPLVSEAMPTTGFRKWVTTILSMTQVSQNVILLALMFIYRLKRLNPGVKGKVGSEFRLLTVALMLGNKFLDDNTYTNKTWAEVSGISVQEIHVMEVEFLSNMRYTLYASVAEWDEWHVKLGKFSDYYDKASRIQSGPRDLSLPVPPFSVHPKPPSPPASQNISPPFMTNPTPTNPRLPHPLIGAPYLPPTIPLSATQMPEVDLKPWVRKRSLDDSSSEPPSKRLSMTPSASSSATLTPSTLSNSSATLTPSTLRDSTPPVPRLPMPNLSMSTNNSHGGYGSSAQLPMPSGRAMSTVYANTTRGPQSGMQLPSLGPSTYMDRSDNARGGSSTSEYQNRQSPYPSGSGTPSPTSFSFPQHQQTSNGLSPSGFLVPRSSPYKPVRGVNTLLVPPPSGSMHHPQNVSYDQMHYQPLGKPISERKTGVLPYMPFDTWSQSHQMQHYLPQPNFAS